MNCPNCGSDKIAWSGTTLRGFVYNKACNKCGYCWEPEVKIEGDKQ